MRRGLAAALLLLLVGTGAASAQRDVAAGAGGPWVFLATPELRPLAVRLHEIAVNAPPLPALPADVLAGEEPIRIALAESEAAFDSLTAGAAPDWGAGVAFPQRGFIVLPAYASPRGNVGELPTVLRHELAHVALERYLSPAAIPRWFTEGYASWAAGQLDFEAGWILRLSFLTGRAPPLDSLILGWPAGAADARVAYLLSASAVQWLHERGGDRVLALFLERWKASGRFEASLRATYGLTLGQFERYWIESVRRRYGWLVFFAQASVAWAMLTLLVLVLFVIRRRRDRKRLEGLRETEPPDAPAYWLGEPATPAGQDRPDSAQPDEAARPDA